MNDIDVLRQMYAVLCGAIDDALTLLENAGVHEAKKVLQEAKDELALEEKEALYRAEELYIAGEQTADELTEHRRS